MKMGTCTCGPTCFYDVILMCSNLIELPHNFVLLQTVAYFDKNKHDITPEKELSLPGIEPQEVY